MRHEGLGTREETKKDGAGWKWTQMKGKPSFNIMMSCFQLLMISFFLSPYFNQIIACDSAQKPS